MNVHRVLPFLHFSTVWYNKCLHASYDILFLEAVQMLLKAHGKMCLGYI